MIITDIKPQVKSIGRYSVYIDGVFAFGLSDTAIADNGLRIGKTIDADQLAQLNASAKDDKAFYNALSLIARRQRSEWEMRVYLQQKGYHRETIHAVIDKLYSYRYLDDLSFAQRWVENRRLLKRISKRRLRQELQQKHVSKDIIEQVLLADKISEIAVLREVILSKRQQSRYKDDQKLIAYLIRQGYGYEDIKRALADSQITD